MNFFANFRRASVAKRLGKNKEAYKQESEFSSKRKSLAGKISRDEEILKIASEKNRKNNQKNINKQTTIHTENNGAKFEANQVVGYQRNNLKSNKKSKK